MMPYKDDLEAAIARAEAAEKRFEMGCQDCTDKAAKLARMLAEAARTAKEERRERRNRFWRRHRETLLYGAIWGLIVLAGGCVIWRVVDKQHAADAHALMACSQAERPLECRSAPLVLEATEHTALCGCGDASGRSVIYQVFVPPRGGVQ